MFWVFAIVAVIIAIYVYKGYKSSSHSLLKEAKLSQRITMEYKPNIAILPEQFVIVDIETTGLDTEKHEIIEIGAIKVNRASNNHETWTSLIKPRNKPSKEIIEMTGITAEMLDQEGATLKAGIEGFLDFVGDLRLVAFNAQFDIAFLSRAATQFDRKISNPVSCALAMARRAWPGLRSYKLEVLAKQANLDTTSMHRALADCQLALAVYAAAAVRIRDIK